VQRAPKIDRARRNALKAAGLVVGAVLTTAIPHKQASAQSQPGSAGGDSILDFFRDILRDLFRHNNGSGGNSGPSKDGSCFARGTLVRTRAGYRPVETLAAEDEVAVRFGGFAPIKTMIGHTVNSVAGKWDTNPGNLPVVIRRGALGENMPSADLCLTAQHAVYVDGFLVKAGDLINGTSIFLKAVDGQESLDFFNIELESHDIVEVQGACFESLYKQGTERCALLGFNGGRSRLRSHMRSVASLVIDRRQPIDVIRDRLDEQGLGLAQAA